MYCNISLLKTQEILLPYQSYSIPQTKKNIAICLEVQSGIECKLPSLHRTFSKSCFIISRHFHLVNPTSSPLSFSGFTFTFSKSLEPFIPLNNALIIDKQERGVHPFPELFLSLLTNPVSTNHIALIEQALVILLKQAQGLNKHVSAYEKPIGKIDCRLIYIHRYIRQHYTEPLTLSFLADLISCNPVYMSNMYSKLFHISPVKHMQQVRMQKATEMLLTSTPIHEIANRLGYISASQFSELFKRYHGLSPREYKRERVQVNKIKKIGE